MRFLALVLVLAACPSPGGDDKSAIEAMIEVKLEMRAAIDELKKASGALDEARAEIDRARGDLDRSRRALDKALDKAAVFERAAASAGLDELDLPPLPSRTLDPELTAGITCVEEGLCTIKHSVIEALAAEPTALVKQARVVPSIKDGEAKGFKVYGIRPGSLPKLIGMKNGDLITAINGKQLRSMDDTMAVFTGLRKAKKLDLVGERKGEPLSITITIADDEAPPKQ